MGRPRPRPAAETSTFADALETIAPSPELLDALETAVPLLVYACRNPEAIDRVVTENANVLATNTRLKAENLSLLRTNRELQAAIDAQMGAVMALQARGIVVDLPKSILAKSITGPR
jgi:hypothetical protein